MGLFSGKKKETGLRPTVPEETDQIPTVAYRVLHSGIVFYTDEHCQDPVADAKIVILEALDPDLKGPEPDVVPSYYQYDPGQLVSWELNKDEFWEECWYRSPITNQVEKAWTMHIAFVGKRIAEQALKEKGLAK